MQRKNMYCREKKHREENTLQRKDTFQINNVCILWGKIQGKNLYSGKILEQHQKKYASERKNIYMREKCITDREKYILEKKYQRGKKI